MQVAVHAWVLAKVVAEEINCPNQYKSNIGLYEMHNTIVCFVLQDVPLILQSQQRIDISAGSSELRLGQNALNISTDSFQVFSQDQPSPGEPLLSVTSDGVTVGAAVLEARGTLGTTLEGPLETSQVQSAPNQPLRLEAPSGNVSLIGSSGVSIQAGPLGNVDITSTGDINLQSQNGDVSSGL